MALEKNRVGPFLGYGKSVCGLDVVQPAHLHGGQVLDCVSVLQLFGGAVVLRGPSAPGHIWVPRSSASSRRSRHPSSFLRTGCSNIVVILLLCVMFVTSPLRRANFFSERGKGDDISEC